ncbi:hypothetical protein EJ05DRAFT_182334 [Pseudovirgaria hyperparasitica]|uniref:Uncharacterized protein n=1 Tax=Pseudovirgaria hyperparasitica TaxID=470096 RepID=A0A6A6WHJ1_9PEZI|nr:uncharacterized protein EJ05DRAFT_182334 [Pseudovirgaria hyperparasitica]KAF2761699.1 hypothetical protein EJ05DRAFT_182334 [Pseudovirgaria hyperparasitica]
MVMSPKGRESVLLLLLFFRSKRGVLLGLCVCVCVCVCVCTSRMCMLLTQGGIIGLVLLLVLSCLSEKNLGVLLFWSGMVVKAGGGKVACYNIAVYVIYCVRESVLEGCLDFRLCFTLSHYFPLPISCHRRSLTVLFRSF